MHQNIAGYTTTSFRSLCNVLRNYCIGTFAHFCTFLLYQSCLTGNTTKVPLDFNGDTYLFFRANMFCNTKSESCLPKLLPGEVCEKNLECFQSLCLEPQRQPQHQPRGPYQPRRSLYILIFSFEKQSLKVH